MIKKDKGDYSMNTLMPLILEYMPIILICAGPILIIIIIEFLLIRDKKRKENIKKYCEENGLKYQDELDSKPNSLYGFKIVHLDGYNSYTKTYTSVMSGERNGISFTILDYKYGTGSKNGQFGSTLCVLSKDGVSLPEFAITTGYCSFPLINRINVLDNPRNKNIKLPKKFINKFFIRGIDSSAITNLFNEDIQNIFNSFYSIGFECEAKSTGQFLTSHWRSRDINSRLKILDDSIRVYEEMLKQLEANKETNDEYYKKF